MGRKNIIPALEKKIGQPLKPFIESEIRKGKSPDDIGLTLGVGKTTIYSLIKDFDLKGLQKEARKIQKSGQENEFNQYVEKYIAEKESAGISKGTIQADRDLWDAYNWWLEYTGRQKTLFVIKDKDTIQTFFNYLTNETERFGRHYKKGVGKVTLMTYKKRMQAFFNWLVLNKIIGKEVDNPFKMMIKIRMEKRLPEDMPDEIILKVLNNYDESTFKGLRDKTLMMCFLETGMRLGGVSNMKLTQFDWNTGIGKIIEKGSKQRTIVLSKLLKEQFIKYLKAREPLTKIQPVWISEDGKALEAKSIYKIVIEANKIPGIKEDIARLAPGNRFHPHLFRHVWAKHLAQSEVPGFAMMVMGGWEDLKLVHHYAQAYSQETAWKYIDKSSPLSVFKEKSE